MAIKTFPFKFMLYDGKIVVVETENERHYKFHVLDRAKQNLLAAFEWTPTTDDYRQGDVKNNSMFTKTQYEAIRGFWAIYND